MAKTASSLNKRLKTIQLFLCDVDGVLTDGTIYIGGTREVKRFHIRDGLGMVLARRAGLKVGWVSARPSPATTLRARELGIDHLVQQGDHTSKSAAVETVLKQEKLTWGQACFVGDDIIDLGPLKRCGLAVAVGNAVPEAKAAAHYVTRNPGGHGAVRETIELILKAQGLWNAFSEAYSS